MAAKRKPPASRRKLKVFRTPIGFHDAYVAATSRKAALEAWGADSDLFAQGIAEQVTDPKLTEAPLERPGEVVRVARGSEAEHVAALGSRKAAKRKTAPTPAPPLKGRGGPKPSRAGLDEADAALEEADRRHKAELRAIDRELQALDRRRRELMRRHEAERDELADRRGRAKTNYERAMRAWERG